MILKLISRSAIARFRYDVKRKDSFHVSKHFKDFSSRYLRLFSSVLRGQILSNLECLVVVIWP